MNPIIDHLDIWSSVYVKKATTGRGSNGKISAYGIQKLRELILELAVRGKLVPQDPNDEPATVLLEKIAEEKARLVKEKVIKKQKLLPSILDEEEVIFGIPKGWEFVRFSKLSREILTGPFGSMLHKDEYVSGGVPLVNPFHMIGGQICEEASVAVGQEKAEELESYKLVQDDIVMARRGELGRCAIVTLRESGWLCGTGSFILRFHKDISREFILFLFQSDYVRGYLGGESVGATMTNLNHGILRKMPVVVPPVAEQLRIVTKINELLALCDQLEQQQTDSLQVHQSLVRAFLDRMLRQAQHERQLDSDHAELVEAFDTLFTTEESIDQLKQTILQLAVMGKLIPQDPSDEPASILLENIAEEKTRLIKEGKIKKQKSLSVITKDEKTYEKPYFWEWVRFDDLSLHSEAGWSPKCKPTPREGEGWGVLKVSAVTWGEFRCNENKALPENLEPRPQCEVMPGDFLISRANTADLVARAVVVPSDVKPHLMMSDKIIRFVFSSSVNHEYLNLVNSSMFARKYYARVAGGTSSSMKNVSREQIRKLVVALPPFPEQNRIVSKVDELMAFCDTLKARIQDAQTTQTQLADAIVEQAVI